MGLLTLLPAHETLFLLLGYFVRPQYEGFQVVLLHLDFSCLTDISWRPGLCEKEAEGKRIWGRGEVGGTRRKSTVVGMYCMREASILNLKKKEEEEGEGEFLWLFEIPDSILRSKVKWEENNAKKLAFFKRSDFNLVEQHNEAY